MGNRSPVIQRMDLVEFGKAGSGIACGLAHRENIGLRSNMDIFGILQDIRRCTAAEARKDKPDSLCSLRFRHGREGAHHHDVGISEFLCNVLCHIETVSGSGIAVDEIGTHIGSIPPD